MTVEIVKYLKLLLGSFSESLAVYTQNLTVVLNTEATRII